MAHLQQGSASCARCALADECYIILAVSEVDHGACSTRLYGPRIGGFARPGTQHRGRMLASSQHTNACLLRGSTIEALIFLLASAPAGRRKNAPAAHRGSGTTTSSRMPYLECDLHRYLDAMVRHMVTLGCRVPQPWLCKPRVSTTYETSPHARESSAHMASDALHIQSPKHVPGGYSILFPAHPGCGHGRMTGHVRRRRSGHDSAPLIEGGASFIHIR
jgi:hypothetical protein